MFFKIEWSNVWSICYILSGEKQKKMRPQIKPQGEQMNFRKLTLLLQDEVKTIKFAQGQGILPSKITCACGSVIEKYYAEKRKNGSYYFFRCDKRRCRLRIPLRKTTIFDNAKLKLHQLFILMYCFTQFMQYRKVSNSFEKI